MKRGFSFLDNSDDDSDWVDNSDEEDAKRAECQEVGIDTATGSCVPKVPVICNGLFNMDEVKEEDLGEGKHLNGIPCDAGFVPRSSYCFRKNSGARRIRHDALKFVMGQIEDLKKNAMKDVVDNRISKYDEESKKVIHIRYDDHIDNIKARVRKRLTKIKIPKCYTRSEDYMSKFYQNNELYRKEIEESGQSASRLQKEVEQQLTVLNEVCQRNDILKKEAALLERRLDEFPPPNMFTKCGKTTKSSNQLSENKTEIKCESGTTSSFHSFMADIKSKNESVCS